MPARSKVKTSPRPAVKKSRITLVAPLEHAEQVAATGDFTGWSAEGVSLKRRRDGAWAKTHYLPPGRYEDRLLNDGHWGNNPAAEHVGNAYGSANDVLLVP